MNAEAKCKCTNCSQPISFPVEGVGTTIPCPHCGLDTILFIPPSLSNPATPKNFIADNRNDGNKNIEKTLEIIGSIFFILGMVGAGVALLILIGVLGGFNETGDKTETCIISVCILIGSTFQGVVLWALFNALAEIVRLLRKLVAKT